ncbi:MAG: DUF3341 domain-containing protein [Acetobacteraceae bacterium]|nr:DUF3341 domain-containing protein [Acetobacteraceae bacterium]
MIVAGFGSAEALRRAVASLAPEGARVETFTPDDLDEATEPTKSSAVPIIMLGAGLLGGFGFFALQAYGTMSGYPINVGGRPDFSWPPFIVNAFEFGVLCAIGAGFLGFFAINRMPKLFIAEDACDELREASRDGWFLSVRGGDPKRVRALLDSVGPIALKEWPE